MFFISWSAALSVQASASFFSCESSRGIRGAAPGCNENMVKIFAPSAPSECVVGRLVPTNLPGVHPYEVPMRVRRENERSSIAEAKSGDVRQGAPADVKPGFHWLLKKLPNGSYELMPVTAWYEFAKPSMKMKPEAMSNSRTSAQMLAKVRAAKQAEAGNGEAELRKAAKARKDETDRWEAMKLRRDSRQSVRVARGQLQAEILRPSFLDEPEAAAPKVEKVQYPEEERINDETGVKKQTMKLKKAQRKEAKAMHQAEDEDAPETANALLSLKAERGEDGWDFQDEEQYSDDEQDKFDFDDQIQPTGADEENAPSADEDEGEEVEKGAILTTHGKQLEILLSQFEEGPESMVAEAATAPEDEDSGEDPGGDQKSPAGSGASSPGNAAGSAAVGTHAPTQISSSDSDAENRASPKSSPAAAAEAGSAPPASKRRRLITTNSSNWAGQSAASASPPRQNAAIAAAPKAAVGATGSSTAPAPAAASRSSEPPAPAIPITKDALRAKLVQCLLAKGGRCALSEAAGALGLKDGDRHSPMWQQAIACIKEVASTQRVPGETRPMLVLLQKFCKP